MRQGEAADFARDEGALACSATPGFLPCTCTDKSHRKSYPPPIEIIIHAESTLRHSCGFHPTRAPSGNTRSPRLPPRNDRGRSPQRKKPRNRPGSVARHPVSALLLDERRRNGSAYPMGRNAASPPLLAEKTGGGIKAYDPSREPAATSPHSIASGAELKCRQGNYRQHVFTGRGGRGGRGGSLVASGLQPAEPSYRVRRRGSC